MNNILSLINPARIITRDDLMNLAGILNASNPAWIFANAHEVRAIRLLQSFESLYALKLEKGHFVCEAEEPDSWNDDGLLDRDKYAQDVRVYNEQQAKVIFEGFEETTLFDAQLKGSDFGLDFNQWDGDAQNSTDLWFDDDNSMFIRGATIRDLYCHISKYNETAAQKIELKYTSNILSLLKIEG